MHCADCFACVVSFSPPTNPIGLLSLPQCPSSSWPKVMELVSGRAGIWPICVTPSPSPLSPAGSLPTTQSSKSILNPNFLLWKGLLLANYLLCLLRNLAHVKADGICVLIGAGVLKAPGWHACSLLYSSASQASGGMGLTWGFIQTQSSGHNPEIPIL